MFTQHESFTGMNLNPENELLLLQEYLRIYGRLAVNSFALRVLNNNEEENVGTGELARGLLIIWLNSLTCTLLNVMNVFPERSFFRANEIHSEEIIVFLGSLEGPWVGRKQHPKTNLKKTASILVFDFLKFQINVTKDPRPNQNLTCKLITKLDCKIDCILVFKR